MARSIPLPLLPGWIRWAGVFVIAGVILYLSVITAPPEQVIPKPEYLPLDKWRHFLAYGAFGYSLAYAMAGNEVSIRHKVIVVFAVTTSFGIGIEYWQSILPARYFGVGDAIANAIGAVLSMTWFVVEPRLRYVERWPAE